MMDYIPPIHKEGHKFIAIFAIVTVIALLFNNELGMICIALTIWCALFFRNPVRIVPRRDGIMVSPADGIVQSIASVSPPAELNMPAGEYRRVSVFMNVFNVHVNRIPVTGEITKLHYIHGAFFNASLDKASEQNERMLIAMKNYHEDESKQYDIAIVQIAGLVARRIVCHLKEEQRVSIGQELGLIRFGSRVDLYLPADIDILVSEGQTMIAGESVIAQY